MFRTSVKRLLLFFLLLLLLCYLPASRVIRELHLRHCSSQCYRFHSKFHICLHRWNHWDRLKFYFKIVEIGVMRDPLLQPSATAQGFLPPMHPSPAPLIHSNSSPAALGTASPMATTTSSLSVTSDSSSASLSTTLGASPLAARSSPKSSGYTLVLMLIFVWQIYFI